MTPEQRRGLQKWLGVWWQSSFRTLPALIYVVPFRDQLQCFVLPTKEVFRA